MRKYFEWGREKGRPERSVGGIVPRELRCYGWFCRKGCLKESPLAFSSQGGIWGYIFPEVIVV